jgi:predicted flavoprotein YhiN
MNSRRIIVVGGGAAGFFAAITCAETTPDTEVIVLEKGPQFLSKVRISGGGRCNVTHACFDAQEFATRYPRGEQALRSPFRQFQASDTVAWFESRGVNLKTEDDGRMFPVTDSSQTIIDCLMRAARDVGVRLRSDCGVERVTRNKTDGFCLEVSVAGSAAVSAASSGGGPLREATETRGGTPRERAGSRLSCDRLLLATGGCRAASAGQLATSLGHTLEPCVPSLFTFHINVSWLRALAGVTIEQVEAAIPSAGLRERGPLLITHWGLSGPVILRLSAWGARELNRVNYQFPLLVNWLPGLNAEAVTKEMNSRRQKQPAKLIVNTPLSPLPARLWEQLVLAAGISRETRWAELARSAQHQLAQQLTRTELPVSGKSLNKDEFVTCGGVRLSEVNFKTMVSRICPGLYFAGELLDIDGITGGFNFQAAWTTGWIAGRAMAG